MPDFLSCIRLVSSRVALCLTALAGVLMVACGGAEPPVADTAARRHLLIVLDGLRPDYVRPSLMPALYGFGRRGVLMTRHHAVYPTVTRVNASSISTGSYPETHGLLGNSVFFPRVDPARFLSTSERANLLRVEDVESDRLLTATTLGIIVFKTNDF